MRILLFCCSLFLINLPMAQARHGEHTCFRLPDPAPDLKKMKECRQDGPTYSLVSGDYRYESVLYPANVPVPEQKGMYARAIRIWQISSNEQVFEQSWQCRMPEEPALGPDTFRLLQVNFDGVADMHFNLYGKHLYYLSWQQTGKALIFYQEKQLLKAERLDRDEARQVLSFRWSHSMSEYTYTFRGKYLDTLILRDQDRTKPITNARLFRYINGPMGRMPWPGEWPLLVPPEVHTDTADFNFDGYPDYRIQEMQKHHEWNYFMYDSLKGEYVSDTLLSRLENVYFDTLNRQFTGITYTNDGIHSVYKTYEMRQGKLVLVRIQDCVAASWFAEKKTCTISELRNGRMEVIWVDYGAE